MEHVAPGTYVFEITTRSGRIEQSEAIEIKRLKPNQSSSSRLIVLPPTYLVDGLDLVVEVHSNDGLPVPSASVEVSQPATGVARHIFGGSVDSKGVANLDGIDAAMPMHVGCAAPGFTRFSEDFEHAPPLVTCTLARLARIKG